ncbi:MAG TPA: hypothetical protein VFR91_05190 [Dyella sp.]|nr:hypothetical protein [Dyella sp.]
MNTMTDPDRTTGHGWTAVRWGSAAALLALPWVAMQFDTGVNWSAGDFVVFGAMLAAVCGTWELVARRRRGAAYRVAAGVALAAAFLELWIDLAVGIAGSPGGSLNRLFLAVLALGIGGTVLVRGRAAGMTRVMAMMALVQAGVGVAIAGATATRFGPLVVLSLLFTGLWLLCAGLFARAARERRSAA